MYIYISTWGCVTSLPHLDIPLHWLWWNILLCIKSTPGMESLPSQCFWSSTVYIVFATRHLSRTDFKIGRIMTNLSGDSACSSFTCKYCVSFSKSFTGISSLTLIFYLQRMYLLTIQTWVGTCIPIRIWIPSQDKIYIFGILVKIKFTLLNPRKDEIYNYGILVKIKYTLFNFL